MTTKATTTTDAQNELYLFHEIATELLVKIVRHKVDVEALATYELRMRGLNNRGEWIGLEQANKFWEDRHHGLRLPQRP